MWLTLSLCEGEACWWTIHPASKQRSEGEKVRVGDDLILVSVATERYLVTIGSRHVQLPTESHGRFPSIDEAILIDKQDRLDDGMS